MLEGAAAELDEGRRRGVRARSAATSPSSRLPGPRRCRPTAPILELGQMSALISDIELHASRY